MADAYDTVFLIAFVLVAISTVVAIVFLPKLKPEPMEDPDDPAVLASELSEPAAPLVV